MRWKRGRTAEDLRLNLGGGCVRMAPVAVSCGPPTQPAAERAARRVGVRRTD